MDDQSSAELSAKHYLVLASEDIVAAYWSESDHRKTFHRDQMLAHLKTAAGFLGFELVKASKAEAA